MTILPLFQRKIPIADIHRRLEAGGSETGRPAQGSTKYNISLHGGVATVARMKHCGRGTAGATVSASGPTAGMDRGVDGIKEAGVAARFTLDKLRGVFFAAVVSTAFVALSSAHAADAPGVKEITIQGSLPAPLVYLRDVDASIIQDMRYAGPDNFTGAPVPGYTAPECILTRKTAEALAAVQRQLTEQKLSLKVYDCYRPVKAVAAFMRWVNSKASDKVTARFHPDLPRKRLVSLGYIAARSGHSRANVVDLTIVALPIPKAPAFEPQRIYGACTAGAEARAPDDSLDMGTGFDCFDPKSNVGAPAISDAQERNRRTLAQAMARGGFKAYPKEWWHFSFPPGDPGRAFDVDIAPYP